MASKYGLGPYGDGPYGTGLAASYVQFAALLSFDVNLAGDMAYETKMGGSVNVVVNLISTEEYMGTLWVPITEVPGEIWLPVTEPNPAFRG